MTYHHKSDCNLCMGLDQVMLLYCSRTWTSLKRIPESFQTGIGMTTECCHAPECTPRLISGPPLSTLSNPPRPTPLNRNLPKQRHGIAAAEWVPGGYQFPSQSGKGAGNPLEIRRRMHSMASQCAYSAACCFILPTQQIAQST